VVTQKAYAPLARRLRALIEVLGFEGRGAQTRFAKEICVDRKRLNNVLVYSPLSQKLAQKIIQRYPRVSTDFLCWAGLERERQTALDEPTSLEELHDPAANSSRTPLSRPRASAHSRASAFDASPIFSRPASIRSPERRALPYSYGRKRLAEWPQYQVQPGPMQPVSSATETVTINGFISPAYRGVFSTRCYPIAANVPRIPPACAACSAGELPGSEVCARFHYRVLHGRLFS
jgi:hypothetical protein